MKRKRDVEGRTGAEGGTPMPRRTRSATSGTADAAGLPEPQKLVPHPSQKKRATAPSKQVSAPALAALANASGGVRARVPSNGASVLWLAPAATDVLLDPPTHGTSGTFENDPRETLPAISGPESNSMGADGSAKLAVAIVDELCKKHNRILAKMWALAIEDQDILDRIKELKTLSAWPHLLADHDAALLLSRPTHNPRIEDTTPSTLAQSSSAGRARSVVDKDVDMDSA